MPELQDFTGRWRLIRRIEDRKTGLTGRFEGEATLTPVQDAPPGTLAYFETGRLSLGGAPPMTAERRYLWSPGPGGAIVVAFDDGRPFHGFDPATGTAGASHWCDPDSYSVTYDFTRWPDWRAIWEVDGPRKDYRMESRYTR